MSVPPASTNCSNSGQRQKNHALDLQEMALGESVAFSMSVPPASTNCSRSGQKSMRWIYKIWHWVRVLHSP
eukprot:1157912-Pelagomonas_calceolata.AAC.6